jgi:hypothetical protein
VKEAALQVHQSTSMQPRLAHSQADAAASGWDATPKVATLLLQA